MGPLLKGENFALHFRSWSAPARLSKIKPKSICFFVHKDIYSSREHRPIPKKKLGSSLRRSRSPVSLRSGGCPSQKQASSNNSLGDPNLAAIRRTCEDTEMDFDGESPCFNMPQDSSSEGEDTEDEIGSDS